LRITLAISHKTVAFTMLSLHAGVAQGVCNVDCSVDGVGFRGEHAGATVLPESFHPQLEPAGGTQGSENA
jgi:hypothetical protein